MSVASNETELRKLRKELIRCREIIEDLNYDIKLKEEKLVEVTAERERFKAEVEASKSYLMNVKEKIKEKVAEALKEEQKKNADKLEKYDSIQRELETEKELNRRLEEFISEKEDMIAKYRQQLKELSTTYDLTDAVKEIENYREERLYTTKQMKKLTDSNNILSSQMENIVAENRVLRKLAKVPENYGFDLEQIKLSDRQKLEDYKSQVRYLEKEIEELEAERTQLRYRLRQISTLYSNKPGERYKDLTPDQLYLLDQYAMNLKDGRQEVPLNDRSKELMREIEHLKGQIDALERGNYGATGNNFIDAGRTKNTYVNQSNTIVHQGQGPQLDSATLEVIKTQNEELKAYIGQLLEQMSNNNQALEGQGPPDLVRRGISEEGGKPRRQNAGRPIQHEERDSGDVESSRVQPYSAFSMPPHPIPGPFGNWGDIREGFSYRFNSKMNVDFHDMYSDSGFDQVGAKYEIAFLQLNNLESLRLIEQKEKEYESITLEVKELREELRKCLLVQDELFKKYHEEKLEFEKDKTKKEKELKETQEENRELEAKVKIFEDYMNDTISKSPHTLEAKLALHTKRVALLDVNLIKLSRKYECLKDEESHLRNSYKMMDEEYCEKERGLMEKIHKLLEWKSKASQQLKILLELQRNSFPAEERRGLLSKSEIYQAKLADSKAKMVEMEKSLAVKSSAERQLFEKNEELRNRDEEIAEVELELEIVKKRLEALDSSFKKYTQVFVEIVDTIKKKNISPLQSFQMFDQNNDGRISKAEFSAVINNMQVKLTPDDIDILFLFIDLDGTGVIEYREFLRRLKRSGVLIRRPEEDLIFAIYKAIKQIGMSLEQAFEAFDSDGNRLISKHDMTDKFRKMGMTVPQESLDHFFKMADVSGDGNINFDEFYILFEKIVKDAHMEEKKGVTELDWKMDVMIRLDKVLEQGHMNLLEAFQLIDENKNQTINFEEFLRVFDRLQPKIQQSELQKLFEDINMSKSRSITYNEFLNYMTSAKREQERIKRLLFLNKRAEEFRASDKLMEVKDAGSSQATESNRLQSKISLLEIKLKQAKTREESLLAQLKMNETLISENNKQLKELETSLIKANDLYYKEKEEHIKLSEKLQGGIPRADAEKLRLTNEKLKLETSELKAALNTYRNLYESSIHQVMVLRLTLEKNRHEVETFKSTIKDLQSTADEKALIGKLYHQTMISRWNEAQVNKKYDTCLNDVRKLKIELASIEHKVEEKNDEIYETNKTYKEKLVQIEKENSDLRLRILPTITMTRIESISNSAKELASMKTELEITNKSLREKNYELGLQVDYFDTYKKTLEDLEGRLSRDHTDELSRQLIEMSSKLKDYKLAELKAKRDMISSQEKEEYFNRMLRQQTERIKEMENELAEWDLKYAKREEFWQKRYNEQLKIVFSKQQAEPVVIPDVKFSDKALYPDSLESLGKKTPSAIVEIKRQPTMSLGEQPPINLREVADLKERVQFLEDELKKRSELIRELETKGAVKISEHSILDRMARNMMDEESEKVALATQKTIETLWSMVEEQTKTIERKQQLIEKMKKEEKAAREADAREIEKLNDLLYKEQTKPAINNVNPSFFQNYRPVNQMDQSLIPEFEKRLKEKDDQLAIFKNKVEAEREAKKEVTNKLEQCFKRIEELEHELSIEIKKNEQEKLKKEVETLNKTVKHKEDKIKGLINTIEDLKKDFFKYGAEKVEKEKDFKDVQSKLIDKESHERQLEMRIREAVKKNEENSRKLKDMEKRLDESLAREREYKTKYHELLDKTSALRAAGKKGEENAPGKKANRFEARNKEEGEEAAEEMDGEGGAQKNEEISRLKAQISKLEKDLKAAKQGLNAAYVDITDENGFLVGRRTKEIKTIEELVESIRVWQSQKPASKLTEKIRENDRAKRGFVTSDDFFAELKRNGLMFKENQRALIERELKNPRERNDLDYIKFHYMLKGIKHIDCQTEEQYQVEEKSRPNPQSAVASKRVEPVGESEREKALQRSNDVLKNQLVDLKREKELADRQLSNWKEKYLKLEKEQSMSKNKPAGDSADESGKMTLKKLQSAQELRDRIFELEEKNSRLEKIITVDKESERRRVEEEKQKMEIEIKGLRKENQTLNAQIKGLIEKRLTKEEIKEELDYEKDMIIRNLKEKLEASREKEKSLTEKIFTLDSQNLELKFIRENFDLQIERLRRRIEELEEMKQFYEEKSQKKMGSSLQESGTVAGGLQKKTVKKGILKN